MALVFDDPFKGEEARASLHRMAAEGELEIQDSAVITKNPRGMTLISQEDKLRGKNQKAAYVVGLVAAAVTAITPLIVAEELKSSSEASWESS